jgi:hypothetical protein
MLDSHQLVVELTLVFPSAIVMLSPTTIAKLAVAQHTSNAIIHDRSVLVLMLFPA